MEQQSNRHAMRGNVQGFELPRGCLMTTGIILCGIVIFAGLMARAEDPSSVAMASSVPVALIVVHAVALRWRGLP